MNNQGCTFSVIVLQWNPSNVDSLGIGEVSCIERCPHFRGKICIKKACLGRHSKVFLIQRCPYFRGVL